MQKTSGKTVPSTLVSRLRWVTLHKYCELSGETQQAVYAKRKKSMWLEGVHSTLGPDGKVWVNIKEVEKWVQQSLKQSRSGNLPAL